MKSLSFLVRTLCFSVGFFLPVVSSASATSEPIENSQLKHIALQTKSLEQELARLRVELTAIKNSDKLATKPSPGVKASKALKPTQESLKLASGRNGAVRSVRFTPATEMIDGSSSPLLDNSESLEPHRGSLTINDLMRLFREQRNFLPFDPDVPGHSFVSTGPYVNVPLQYAGSDLIVNSPNVNTDVQLLKIRKRIAMQLSAAGDQIYPSPYHSHLLLSGVVEVQAGIERAGGDQSRSDIDVTNVALDFFYIGPSNWTLAFVELSHDNLAFAAEDNGPFVVNRSRFREANSRVFVNKAFITIGDFTKSPFYGTFGQFYVPFGTYSSVMVSPPLTRPLGRTKSRAIELGFQQQCDDAFYGSIYVLAGESHVSNANRVQNGGINLGYRFVTDWITGDFGGGIIANIADSVGMQLGNNFAHYEKIHHRVPAYNVRGNFNFGEHINFLGEYIGASTSFNPNDMSFNGHGAKPSAFDIEAAYSFYILDKKPSAIGIGYSKSQQALSLGLPLTRYYAVFNTSLWRNTLQSIEFRHDRNYAAHTTANGPVGAESFPGQCVAAACSASGKGDNGVTAQFDYYF